MVTLSEPSAEKLVDPMLLEARVVDPMLPLLRGIQLDDLERSEDVIFGLLPDYRLGYVNPAWVRFADANGAPDLVGRFLGRSVLLATPEALRSYYAAAYWRVIRHNSPWEYTFQCPSATLQRLFRMLVLPLPKGGLLVTSSLVFEAPRHDGVEASEERLAREYTDDHGRVLQCSHCRRLRRSGEDECWDFVPLAVEQPLPVASHGLCSPCACFLYPTLSDAPPS